jgi:hypothetical protein
MLPLRKAPAVLSLFCATSAAAVVAAAFATPMAQASTCAGQAVSTPFSRFGDANQYFLAPNGSFEGGTSGWALSNASASFGNESYFLHSSSDTHSLKLTGSALSPTFCITRNDPMLRFVAKTVTTPRSWGNYSQLQVSIIVRNSAGSQGTFWLGAIQPQGNGNWFVVPQLSYGHLLDSWLFGPNGTGTATMQIQFIVAGQGGTWSVDDVYVDPFAGR